ncbi:MAG: amidohydrolase family protein [Nitrospinaceae bacterium]|nr:amidohydrolase family protein [Nitrospinaceae bacterium]
MTLKIKFRVLLTQCSEPVENGELIIEGGDILEISPQASKVNTEYTLDLSDHLLMPGFVNAHSHLSLTALENKLSPSKNFACWIRDLIILNTALKDEERIGGIQKGASEMKSSGVTGLADYVADSVLLDSIGSLGFRSVLFLEIIGFQDKKAEGLAKEVERIFKSHGSIWTLGIAPHAPYSVSKKLFHQLDQLSKKYGCLLSTHLAETDEESQFIEKGEGPLVDLLKDRKAFDANWKAPATSPVRYLKSFGALNEMVAVHCNFIDGDTDAVKAAVFCPKSTHWFGRSNILPVRKMLDDGVPVALGTDSMASNDSLNFLEEIRMADKLLPEVSRKEILKMATRFGAEILRLPCGKIEPGQKGDFIGFKIGADYDGDWHDIPFEPQRNKVDFYMMDGKF